MKAPILLKNFTHSLFPASVVTSKQTAQDNHHDDNHTSSLIANVDFEIGKFRLQGDWHFIMSCNKNAEPAWYNYHAQRINIEATIYPSAAIDLNDYNNDGAIFILEGFIKDSDTDSVNACSGMLVLDKTIENNFTNTDAWNICFYLYDNKDEECEIAFKLLLHVSNLNIMLN